MTAMAGNADERRDAAFPRDLESYAGRCDPIPAARIFGRMGRRPRDAHKGDFGHILVAGGSAGFGGAPALAALAALRTGSGLVSVALPASLVCGPVARLAPEAMAHPIEEDCGHITENGFLTWLFARRRFDATAIGPGLGQSTDTDAIVKALLKMHDLPLVLDADALNIIAASGEGLDLVRREGCPARILTPHHAEAARLLGCTAGEVAADRAGAVLRLAGESGAVAVLKGRGTLVAAPGMARPFACLRGNPGMATGGSGDVLAGIIASLVGQGLAPLDAACAGVELHAAAGDAAAAEKGERAMIARDIIDALPRVFRDFGIE